MKLPLLSTSSVDPNIRDQLIYMENKEREHQNQKKTPIFNRVLLPGMHKIRKIIF